MQIESALSEWKRILGDEHVQVDRTELSKCEQATFAVDTRVHAVLLPASTTEIQGALKIANSFSIPVHVVSRGRNCGYGSKAPYRDSVLIDLRRLQAIRAYDEDLAFVQIEAGVTQAQLADFLRAQGGKLWMDPIATFEDCSVLANILERGHGLTGHADRIASGTDYEIVLPNGELIRTGYSAIPGSRLAGLDRWAAGPSFESLFSQSNLGIVTAMTVWLKPKPASAKLLTFTLDSHSDLSECVNRLRRLKLESAMPFGPRFFNEIRLIQTFARYPWEKMQNQMPLSEVCIRELQNEMSIPLWTGTAGFYGTQKQIEANCELVEQAIQGLAVQKFSVSEDFQPSRDLKPVERFAHALYRGMTGNVERVTQRPRWRKRTAQVNADWSQDRCGIIWFPVSVPFRGEDLGAAVAIVRESVFSYGFEPDMSVSAIRERTLEVNCSIVFDRDDEVQERNAGPCARETLARLAQKGFHSHRLGIPTMDAYGSTQESNRKLLAQVKALVDPNSVLSQGRYQ